MDEVYDLVDSGDIVIGAATRAECHGNPALIHRAVHVLVFDGEGMLCLQRRKLDKDIQPGKWDSSVGGHVAQGEDYRAAAVREAREELGLDIRDLKHAFDYRIRNQIESENVRSFITRWDGPVHADDAEIEESQFWSIEEIESSIGTGLFTPSFEVEFQLLKENRIV